MIIEVVLIASGSSRSIKIVAIIVVALLITDILMHH